MSKQSRAANKMNCKLAVCTGFGLTLRIYSYYDDDEIYWLVCTISKLNV